MKNRTITLSRVSKYLSIFSEFVEHALRLQAQSERKIDKYSRYALDAIALFCVI